MLFKNKKIEINHTCNVTRNITETLCNIKYYLNYKSNILAIQRENSFWRLNNHRNDAYTDKPMKADQYVKLLNHD